MIAEYEDAMMSKRVKIAGMAGTLTNSPKLKNKKIITPRS